MENSSLVGSKQNSDLISGFLENPTVKNVKIVGIVLGAVFLGTLASFKIAQRLEKHPHPLAKNKWLVNGVAIASGALITKVALSLFRINNSSSIAIVSSFIMHFVGRDLHARYEAWKYLKNSFMPESLVDVVMVIWKAMKMRKDSTCTLESVLKELDPLLNKYKNNPRMLGWIYMERGHALVAKKDVPTAIAAYTESLKYFHADDTNMMEFCALYERSKCLNHIGQRKEAIQDMEEAIKLAHLYQVKRKDERLYQMHNRLAQFFIADNQLDKASACLQFALNSSLPMENEEIAKAYRITAEIYLKRNQPVTALNYATKLFQLKGESLASAKVFCARKVIENHLPEPEKNDAVVWLVHARAFYSAKDPNHAMLPEIDALLSQVQQNSESKTN